jgi:hypothetical protein
VWDSSTGTVVAQFLQGQNDGEADKAPDAAPDDDDAMEVEATTVQPTSSGNGEAGASADAEERISAMSDNVNAGYDEKQVLEVSGEMLSFLRCLCRLPSMASAGCRCLVMAVCPSL